MAQEVKTIVYCDVSAAADTTGICPTGQAPKTMQAIVLISPVSNPAEDFQNASVVSAYFFVGLISIWGITSVFRELSRMLR